MREALLALGGPVARAARTLLPADGSLTERESLVVAALASRIFRPDEADLPPPSDVPIAPFVSGLARRMDETTRGELALVLFAVEHVLPRAQRHVRPFTALSGPAQDAVLAAMETSPIVELRGALDSLKALCAMGYLRDVRTWDALGYDGPARDRPAAGWVAAAGLARGARR